VWKVKKTPKGFVVKDDEQGTSPYYEGALVQGARRGQKFWYESEAKAREAAAEANQSQWPSEVLKATCDRILSKGYKVQ